MANVTFEKQLRQDVSTRLVPLFEASVKTANAGLNFIFDVNGGKLPGQYRFCSDMLAMAVFNFKQCFKTTAWGSEDLALERAIGWVSMLLTTMREAYKSGAGLKVRTTPEFNQGGLLMKGFLQELEREQYRLKKRRLIKPEDIPKEVLSDW